MKKLEKSVSINSPIDKVFNYISDPMNNTEWLPSMIEIKDVDLKDEGVKTSYHWIYKMGGLKFSGESVCTEYATNKKIVVQSKGGIKSMWDWTFEQQESGTNTKLIVEYDIPIPVLGKLAEAIVLKQNNKEADQAMANLKKILES